jgi:outer membrane protein assembly factor BamA
MPKHLKYLPILSLLWLSACSVTKKLPPGESLYKGAEIKIVADSLVTKKQANIVKADLELLVRPIPNSLIFGFPYKVWFYYLFGEPKQEKGFKYAFRKRLGEAPVLANKRTTALSSELIVNYLNNEGYFRSTAEGKLVEKKLQSTAIYTAYLKPRYIIDSVGFDKKDTSIFGKALLETQANSLLKPKEPYRFQAILDERNRIDDALKQKGFYLFRPDYIIILADTMLGNHRANLSVLVKSSTSQVARKPYFIKDIFIYSNDSKIDTSTALMPVDDRVVKSVHLINFRRNYRRRIFLDAIGFRSGVLYNSDIENVSISRLINLNNFKFVRNRFDLVSRSDSALLNVSYYVTPLKGKSVRAEIGGESKSNGLVGTKLSLNWKNRNVFRGAELLSFNGAIIYDWQVGGQSVTNFTNIYRWTLNANLAVPRFLVPFIKVNPITNQALPQTNFGLGFEKIINKTLYDLTSFNATMGYSWRRSSSIEHSLTPVSLSYFRPSNINNEFFTEQVFRSSNPLELLRILEPRFILGGTYNFTFTPKQKINQRHAIYFYGGIDIAGNLAGLVAPKAAADDEPRKIFGVDYEQYGRFDIDFRYYYDVSPKLRWANRFVAGVGIPYGNSKALPYFKQFFSGGTNSIRAFRARTFGPGSYIRDDSTLAKYVNSITGGDIKLELNTELRAKFTKFLNGAIFVDAGNVWLYKDASFYDERAVFSNNFLKEFAVGTGIGLRLDFSFVLLRLDVAFPIRKPWLPENERWVFKDIDFSSHIWRDNNIILNIAVGYPF